MSRKCSVTGKKVMVGNNVSHAKNRTRRRFLPNLQAVTLYSIALKQRFQVRVTTRAIRTIEHNGGFDSWLLNTSNIKLDSFFRRLKKRIQSLPKSS